MYKQCSLILFLFPLSLSLSLLLLLFFSSLFLRFALSTLNPKFKAYLINRHSVFVWLCVCVPVLGMIRRERVRESRTVTEGLVFRSLADRYSRSTLLVNGKQETGNPRAATPRDTATTLIRNTLVSFTMSFNISALVLK